MALTEDQKKFIQDFASQPGFKRQGGLMTDLDGTIVQHQAGNYTIPP